ncbi:MAG: magnesium transporter [Ruminococcaceae bacterium]|nr:magnesium transporter [Oscillospiraceae bacterium]
MVERILYLIKERKYVEVRRILGNINPMDIATLFSEFSDNSLPILFRILPKNIATDVFVNMSVQQQETLIKSFSDFELKIVFEDLYLDDAVDIIEEMPANVVKRILLNSSPQVRNQINSILQYPKDSAGSIMTIEYVSFRKNITVSEAFEHIKKTGIDKETIYTCYVTDSFKVLIGLVSAKTLLLSDRTATVESIMETNVIYANTLDDKEEVARIFDKYDFLALPVVDKEKRLVGIVTVDDAIDVILEENEEDISKMAAITPNETPYLESSVFSIWKARIPWLLLLMVSATVTGMIISGYETALAKAVILTTFIPMLMGTGGNSGSQASVTVIRELSLGDLRFSDIFKVLWKEFRVASLCGMTLSLVEFLKLILVDNLMLGNSAVTLSVSLAVSLTIFFTVLLAKLVGSSLPIFAQKIGFDPAVMASPFITTVVDALSLVIFFAVATSVLNI